MQSALVIRTRRKKHAIPRLTGAVGAAIAAAPVAAQAGGDLKVAAVELPPVTVSGSQHSEFKADGTSSIKTPGPLLDIPKSITVIPHELIQSTASTSLSEVLRSVPGIAFGAGEGGNPVGDRPFIRGYDAQASTFLDGFRDIGAQSREMFNIESVEVTKGPAGAYDGRGSAGGSINIVSKAPRLGNFAEGNFGVGNASYKRATADANWQFGERTAVRMNAMYHDAGVPGRDATHQERWGFAPSVAFGLGTDTRLTLSYYHMESDGLPDTGMPYNNPNFVPRTDGRPRTRLAGDGSPLKVPRNTYYGLVDRDFRKDSADVGTIRFEHDFSPALKFRNQTRIARTMQDYLWTRPDGSFDGNIYYDMVWRRTNQRHGISNTLANQTDLSGEILTGALKHKYAFGVEFSQDKSENDSYNVATGNKRCPSGPGAASGYNCTTLYSPNPNDPWNGQITRIYNPTNHKATTASVYAFDSIELSKQWLVNAGLRFDRYRGEVQTARASSGAGQRSTFARDDNLFNYQFGVVYKPVENASIYASYGTSSTPAGAVVGQGSEPSGLAPTKVGSALSPEKNRSFELGTKWDVLHKRLALTAAIFRVETTNARITLEDGLAAMAGNKRVDGIELGFSGNVTDQWAVFGGYTHLKSELRNNGGSGADFGASDGHAFPNTPSDSFSLWSTYQLFPNLTLGGGAYYVSKVWGSQARNNWVPAYWRFDAMAAYQLNKNVSMQLNVMNLADKVYYNQAYPAHYASIAPGRTAILNVNLRY
ncbi:TonB-dependent receptor [Cupriavidus basilensis]|uniref:TonB-dependent receptor n=1 Tax=Cupriavidus basilensis TaxID=68895 RepID=UPI0023E83F62|nr:TonB-dependent siderophore receptor [Cupriavidus basilensis]MDF3886653.1 TonB-dependent siderophore receptor [Cupriavidus basilensis]